MPTETELVNSALRKIGGGRILDIDEEVASAGIARDVFDQERDDLLRIHTWNFAITRAKLARLATVPTFDFGYAYAKPADCMRIVSVHASSAGVDAIRYKAESIAQEAENYVAVILCDASDVWLRYVRKVTDPNLMEPGFRQVLILRLARVFATSTANSNSLYELIGKELDDAMRRVKSIDGLEDYIDQRPVGDWVTARSGWP